MEYKNLLVDKRDKGIWLVTVNRPKALNALNAELLDEMESFLDGCAKAPSGELRVLIITGAGDKAFVAGADIRELTGLSPQEAQKLSEKGQRVFRKIEKLQVPVIAAVNGFALGGGMELALACDFIYTSDDAKFGLPEVTLGLIPGFGGCVRLSRIVGLNVARELIYSGEMLSAHEALEENLVNAVVFQSELIPQVMKVAETIAARSPVAVARAKQVIDQAYTLETDSGLEVEAKAFAALFETDDAKEGTKAFLEKRKPNFKGN